MDVFKLSLLLTLLSVHSAVLGRVVNENDFSYEVKLEMAPAPSPTIDAGGLVPAMFIFGDSLIDNGNNNNMFSLAKANYPPYGIDFNGVPTGRFSNGYTIVDQIGELLGLPLAPAYSDSPTIDQMRFGVNYASAAAGILDITGEHFVERVPFKDQVTNFAKTIDLLSANLSAQVVQEDIPKCIFFVGMGSNDYLNDYFMPGYPASMMYNYQEFADILIQQYADQLNRLYGLGARKFVLAGVGKMGCIPTMLARSENGQCIDEVNQAIAPFNANMKLMINNFNTTLPDAKFVYLDTINMFRDVVANSKTYGFTNLTSGCCGVGKDNGEMTCMPYSTPCENRQEYIFWDAYHPTSAVNVLLGKMGFNGGPDFAYPINIQQLAMADKIWPF